MPRPAHDLRIHEQILLLGLRDEEGSVESRAGMLKFALGGALLSELLLAGKISVTDDKKKLVDTLEAPESGDPVLDEAYERISAARRRRSASRWVSGLAGIPRLRHRIAEGLCRRGILRDSEEKILLLFTRKVYPTIDAVPERKLIERLKNAVLGDGERLDPRLAVLVALAHGTGLLRVHFDRRTLRARKKRLERLTRGDLVGGATRDAVVAAQTAVIAATIAATAAASSAAH